MGLSTVKSMRTFEEGMVIYSALIAEPATGKSPAMTLVRKALVECEKFFETPNENTQLVNGKFVISSKFFILKFKIFHFSGNC
jgi:hypothetical protein